MPELISPVLAEVRLHHPSISVSEIERAYEVAKQAMRDSNVNQGNDI
mgnify:CR=1 FL=1